MDWFVSLGVNQSDTRRYREESQGSQAAKDAV
jgi:hypothetical protein